MNKGELVAKLAEKNAMSKADVKKVLDGFFAEIEGAIATKEAVQIVGFGTFKVRARNARTARNLRTGEPIDIPAGLVPVFRPGSKLKAAANAANEKGKKGGKKAKK